MGGRVEGAWRPRERLSPSATDTPLIDGATGSKGEADQTPGVFAQMTQLGRLGRPEEMASDEISFCTGIDLSADGGITQL
jgi:hypothetical protein